MISSPLLALLVLALAGPAPTAISTRQALAARPVPVEGGGSYRDVGAAALAAMIEKKNFPLVNVHVPYEGEIPGTDLFIPYDKVQGSLAKLPADKGARLVLYCRSGAMGAIAARALVRLGYTDVWNLDGGIIGWRDAGYPVVRKTR